MKIRNQVLGLAMVMALTAGASSASANADVRIGTVDMQRALQTVEAGKKAKAQLEKEFNKKKQELQTEEAAIRKMGEEFKKQSLALSEDARMKKQAELQERVMKFQETTARSQQEIQQKEQDLTRPIITKLRTLIGEMSKEKGYTVVLEKNENTVLFSLEKDDLTADVVKAFDKKG